MQNTYCSFLNEHCRPSRIFCNNLGHQEHQLFSHALCLEGGVLSASGIGDWTRHLTNARYYDWDLIRPSQRYLFEPLLFHWPCCFGRLFSRKQSLTRGGKMWEMELRVIARPYFFLSIFWFMDLWISTFSKLLPPWSGPVSRLLQHDRPSPLKQGCHDPFLL